MAEDRALRLRGYEVTRFGGHELMGDSAPDMLRKSFTALDERFGSTQSARQRQQLVRAELGRGAGAR